MAALRKLGEEGRERIAAERAKRREAEVRAARAEDGKLTAPSRPSSGPRSAPRPTARR